MKNRLAEQLLATVLDWTPDEVAEERPLVQALAVYKYDEYQQFSTGSHFVESLALWLKQFDQVSERRSAYDFLKKNLVFCSSAELRQLVEISYPDFIRPLLIGRAADGASQRHRPASIVRSVAFRVLQRQCLFLGLSDGAQIDTFRRANPQLNHEQIWHTTEISQGREDKLAEKLHAHLRQILRRSPHDDECRFKTLVLLDDFAASGTSCYGLPADSPRGGKIMDLYERIVNRTAFSMLVDPAALEVIVLLYIATDQALLHLRTAANATWGSRHIPCTVKVVQRLPDHMRILRGGGSALSALIDHPKYYDHAIYDAHFEKGATPDARYGYADCGLPVVLHHNSPNNSVALIMSYEDSKFRGLFPRVQRHREMT